MGWVLIYPRAGVFVLSWVIKAQKSLSSRWDLEFNRLWYRRSACGSTSAYSLLIPNGITAVKLKP